MADKKELYGILLEDLGIASEIESYPSLRDGEIDHVEVSNARGFVRFFVNFTSVLPFTTYNFFYDKLRLAYKDRCQNLELVITCPTPHSDEHITNYFYFAKGWLDAEMPFAANALKNYAPLVRQDELGKSALHLLVETEVALVPIKERYIPALKEIYAKCGFHDFPITAEVNVEAAQEFEEKVQHEREEIQEKLVQNAVEAVKEYQIKKEAAPKPSQQSNGGGWNGGNYKSKKQNINDWDGSVKMGGDISRENITPMKEITEEEKRVTIEGYVFFKELREFNSGSKLVTLKITDYTSAFTVQKFIKGDVDEAIIEKIGKGSWVRVRGAVNYNQYARDLVLDFRDLLEITPIVREDTAKEDEKRVEFHAHSNMSMMDAVNSVSDLVAQAGKWGMNAIAITDHSCVQGYPEAHTAGKKNNVKIIYGLEANMIEDSVPITENVTADLKLALSDATYVVFDVETTGFSSVYDSVIEIGATKYQKGGEIDNFSEFINIHKPLSRQISELTHISDADIASGKEADVVFAAFKEFIKDTVLVAHNAQFDVGFINAGFTKNNIAKIDNPVIDTLELSRFVNPAYGRHNLGFLAKKYEVTLTNAHRAIYDAQATAEVFMKMLNQLKETVYEIDENGVKTDVVERAAVLNIEDFEKYAIRPNVYKNARPFHVTIYATNHIGLKNLFKLVSHGATQTFFREARIPRSVFQEHREGLIIGSACQNGEVFKNAMDKGYDVALNKAKFYDFLEVMPKGAYEMLLTQDILHSEDDLETIIKNIVQIGEELNIPVLATGDVHYINESDSIYRQILVDSITGMSMLKNKKLPQVHFKTTNEMLEDFAFLGEEKAYEIVVKNTREMAERFEKVVPIHDGSVEEDMSRVDDTIKEKLSSSWEKGLFPPYMPTANDDITNLTYETAREMYGEDLPEIVEARIKKELNSIIGNGFAVMYLIAQKLVHKSVADGYLVGSRGSVGSSFVATMTGITEVNPLPPHYYCPECQHSEFITDGSCGSGFDLPIKDCPKCSATMKKDGHDIPFETFLGFHGDKVPDIDLNFSGEYQANAHDYTKVLFGEEYVYRAGTIGTVAEKTAYGYTRAWERDHNQVFRGAEVDRLVAGMTGVKRTTGQHPGGIIVIPDYMDIFDFTPYQFPADDQKSVWKTTHFDFHSIHDNVLKLDILGHDDPTMIRYLSDLLKNDTVKAYHEYMKYSDPQTIPADDPDVMKIFASPEILGVTEEQIGSKSGTFGVPEFGTNFVRGMLEQTGPTTFAELLQISGLSHGTDVWLGNAADLISAGKCTLAEVIGCRDDIMVYLIHAGLDEGTAFTIMEKVRKGQWAKLSDDEREKYEGAMRENNVPEWYMESCAKIKYMFPKAHAAAYVLMALRIAFFKVHMPLYYYSAYFSIRASDYDLNAMVKGRDAVKQAMKEIVDKGKEASNKEEQILTSLELANEMIERGYGFMNVDLYKSDATNFTIIEEEKALLAPFIAIPGLGDNVAVTVVEARANGEFISQEDLKNRTKLTKAHLEYMNDNGILQGMSEKDQISLFDF
ncbi:MAG: PolC-type DNA polymerase III [Lactobacillales bacterium]|jgi:DNA polymerase-3 subunit alpha (Gram-positive type)|nr:PolC-type DNA polymerase III [Lactobacillales bacterium]